MAKANVNVSARINIGVMMNFLATFLLLAATAPSAPRGDTQVRRYLLSAGANNGGRDKVVLRYAVSDAQAFANVLLEMGGVNRDDALILANPSRRELLGAIDNLRQFIANGAEENVRNEIFVYYSGHADEEGVKLAGETLGWAEFRNAVNSVDADVRVAVIDACGSGAITRTKGGVARPAFLSDASMNMKGYAFLTSSNENESSQESDRIKGSYFTHALLSGMRGAADMVGDGKVTINEAYQYAFNETLSNTQNTRAGTQHPSRDMNLAGTGDIVLTDLRRTSATLLLDADIEGRFFIRDGFGNLFAELRKMRGRPIELGIPPGRYTVQMEAPSRMWSAGNVVVVDGGKTHLTMSDMRPMEPRIRTVARGEGGEVADSLYYDDHDEYVYDDGDVTVGVVAVPGDVTLVKDDSSKTSTASDPLAEGAIVNMGEHREKTPIRLINIVDRCVADLTVYADASNEMGVYLRAGVPWFYMIFEFGAQPAADSETSWPESYGLGAGTRFGMNGSVVMNLDFLWSRVDVKNVGVLNDHVSRHRSSGHDNGVDDNFFNELYKARLGVSFIPRSSVAVTGGVSLSGNFECGHIDDWQKPRRFGSMYSRADDRGHRFHMWPGLYLGVSVGKVSANERRSS